MMGTLEDRNQPIDPFNTRKSIDDCSGEEWNAATKSFWNRVEEESMFQGSLFDKADEDTDFLDDEAYQSTSIMIDEELRFEQIIQILGPYYAISYCHGAALDILMDIDNAHNSMAIDVAKVHLTRMSRLINDTQGINW